MQGNARNPTPPPAVSSPRLLLHTAASVTATKRKPCVCPADDLSERMVAPRWVALGSSGGLVPRLRLAGSATGVKTCAATTTTHHCTAATSLAGVLKPGPPLNTASEGGIYESF